MNKLIEAIKNLFRPKSDLELAVIELEDAKRQRLQAATGAEHARHMVDYHTARIKRLEGYIRAHESCEKSS